MRIAIVHIRNSRPWAPVFQSELNELNDAACFAVEGRGAEPRLVPVSELPPALVLREVLDSDAVILMGGEDVSPHMYGGVADYPESGMHEVAADELHLEVIRRCAAAGTPLLGICRGLQLTNIAFGGTLIQHLEGGCTHRSNGVGMKSFARVSVEIEPAYRTDFGGAGGVLCTHHQAIDRVGEGLRVVGRASDGVVEAVVHERLPITGVQWHPEHPAVCEEQLGKLVGRLRREAALAASRILPGRVQPVG